MQKRLAEAGAQLKKALEVSHNQADVKLIKKAQNEVVHV